MRQLPSKTRLIINPYLDIPGGISPHIARRCSNYGRYATRSALAAAISSIMMINGAQAAPPSEQDQVEVLPEQTIALRSGLAKQRLASTTLLTAAQEDDQLHDALDALHLKKAVENGVIDAAVLKAYQQETVNKRLDQITPMSHEPDAKTQSDSKISRDAAEHEPHSNTQSDSLTPLLADDHHKSSSQPSSYQLMSPDEIDSQLGRVENLVNQAASFDAPVATLQSKRAPIGLDKTLNTGTAIIPDNLETLGQSELQSNDPSDIVAFEGQPAQLKEESPLPLANPDIPNEDTQVTSLEQSLSHQNLSHQMTAKQQSQRVQDYIQAANQAKDERSNNQPFANPMANSDQIDPKDFLPDYHPPSQSQAIDNALDDQASARPSRARNSSNIFKRLYNRYFKDGYTALPRIDSTIYLATPKAGSAMPTLVEADEDSQPINNIKAALDDITVQSVADFTAALPRLRETALEAARAVGYYDVELRFRRQSNDRIDVIIDKLGEPVKVNYRLIDIRGEGGDTPEFQKLEAMLPPHEGEVFNHGAYKASKAAIEALSLDQGYFDQYWLNKSVDIILPDNTADVDLIYNTGERYQFGEVIFFTYDEETNELTRDPEKLPLKPELLKQLLGFESGDPYYRPKITKLSNDLSATRYFNTVNVEAILPTDADAALGTLNFDSTAENFDHTADPDQSDLSANKTSTATDDQADLDINILEPVASTPKSDPQRRESLPDPSGDSSLPSSDSTAVLQDQRTELDSADSSRPAVDEQDIAPIEFQVDQQTRDKLAAIRQKAQRLASLPDNRVLDEKQTRAKNLLGRISDSISGVVKTVLPDGSDANQRLKPEKLSGRQSPQQVKSTKKVPLYIYVSSQNPRDAQVGVGYGSDTGVRATTKLDYNLINREGYQAGLEAAASEISKNITVYASRPWSHPLDDTIDARLSYKEQMLDKGEGNFGLETSTITASLARNIQREEGWNRSYSVRYHHDELDAEVEPADRDDLPTRFVTSKPTQEALLLGYGISKLDVDNVSNPTKGIRQYYGIEAGANGALSDTNMVIARAGIRGIYSFGADDVHQLLGRFDGGYLWADSFYDVPYTLRFLAGGDQSIRGYDYQSLSPIKNGYLTGGQILAVGSAEYNYEFKPGLRAAVFTDVGNAYDSDFNTDTKVGVGAGIRWASPIGQVRLDVAAGVTEESIPVRLYFFIGSSL